MGRKCRFGIFDPRGIALKSLALVIVVTVLMIWRHTSTTVDQKTQSASDVIIEMKLRKPVNQEPTEMPVVSVCRTNPPSLQEFYQNQQANDVCQSDIGRTSNFFTLDELEFDAVWGCPWSSIKCRNIVGGHMKLCAFVNAKLTLVNQQTSKSLFAEGAEGNHGSQLSIFTPGGTDAGKVGQLLQSDLKQTITFHDDLRSPLYNMARSLVEKSSDLYTNAVEGCSGHLKDMHLFLYDLGDVVNIYHRTIGWFELYRTMRQTEMTLGSSKVFYLKAIQQSCDDSRFIDFERTVFPKLTTYENFSDNSSCFASIQNVRYTLDSMLFRDPTSTCLQSASTPVFEDARDFRIHVLLSCNIEPPQDKGKDTFDVMIIDRKPYDRKYVAASFQRTFNNSAELKDLLTKKFRAEKLQNATVHLVRLEDIKSICSQIELISKMDVAISVHGAGLTLGWFMQPDSLIIEIDAMGRINYFEAIAKISGKLHEFHEHLPGSTGDYIMARTDTIIDSVLAHYRRVKG